jgi:hypothetical protein
MKDDFALCRIEGTQDRATGRRLTGTAFPYQTQRLTLEDVKADAIHSLHCPGAAPKETVPEWEMFLEISYLKQYTTVFRHPVSPVHTKGSARNVEGPVG